MSITAIIALINGLLTFAPEAIKIYNEIKALNSSGQAPTPEQWADWDARALAVHAELQAP